MRDSFAILKNSKKKKGGLFFFPFLSFFFVPVEKFKKKKGSLFVPPLYVIFWSPRLRRTGLHKPLYPLRAGSAGAFSSSNISLSSPTFTFIFAPWANLPWRSSSARGSSIWLSMALRKGLAPKVGSYPFLMI